jgi:hypothetical protein
MNAFEQTIWAAVFAAELFKSRDAAGGHPIDAAAKAADFAVGDLARYRRTEEATLEQLTRPSNGKAARS